MRKEKEMSWDEFCSLLSGLNAETPLGRVVSIRAETDSERIKRFSKYEREIYDEWNKDKIKEISDEEGRKAVEMITAMFKKMAKE